MNIRENREKDINIDGPSTEEVISKKPVNGKTFSSTNTRLRECAFLRNKITLLHIRGRA